MMPFRFVIPVVLLTLGGTTPAAPQVQATRDSQTTGTPTDSSSALSPGAPVVVLGDTILVVHAALGPLTPEDRAKAIAERLLRLEREGRPATDSLYLVNEEGHILIMAGERPLMSVLPGDAAVAGIALDQLAERHRLALAEAIVSGVAAWEFRAIAWGAVYAALTTLAALLLIWLIRRGIVRLNNLLDRLRASTALPTLRVQQYELVSAERVADLGLALLRMLGTVAWILIVYVYFVLVLSYFPWTANLSTRILSYVTAPLGVVATAILAYLPNLFFIAVILLVTRWLLAVIRSVFRAIGSGKIRFASFERDWAIPTYKLVRFLVLAFALVVLFPYLPGADSDAFKGVSIFMGVLLSLGSTGAVANLTAGTLLTYTRSFQIGDRVRIGETLGDVVGRTLLVTRVRTLTNVEVTIPNSQVMSGQVLNYTALARTEGVALQVTITIGYDVPWRRVHELLIAAASATEGIAGTPAPFVLQTGLNDSYPVYELNAYTNDAARMRHILSALHASVQDRFAAGGVEITSPAYLAVRQGDKSTIPEMTQ